MAAEAVQTCVEIGPVQLELFSMPHVRASLLAQGVVFFARRLLF